MTQFTADELVEATRRANAALEFPLKHDLQIALILDDVIAQAVKELPPNQDCEVVRNALKTLYVMGIDCGIQLERGA